MMYRWFAAFAMLSIVPAAQAAPAECTAKSGPGTAALVELYTSEGCDSCPPADEWLRKLPAAGFGPERVVPLALHVDYWDYIGWKDPFARAAFSDAPARVRGDQPSPSYTRRRCCWTGATTASGRTVCGSEPMCKPNNGRPARAELRLALRGRRRGQARARGRRPSAGSARIAPMPRSIVAAYENGLMIGSPRARTGRDAPSRLRRREWIGPIALDAAGRVELKREGPASGGARKRRDRGFVQSRRTGDVLQALALPACKG